MQLIAKNKSICHCEGAIAAAAISINCEERLPRSLTLARKDRSVKVPCKHFAGPPGLVLAMTGQNK